MQSQHGMVDPPRSYNQQRDLDWEWPSGEMEIVFWSAARKLEATLLQKNCLPCRAALSALRLPIKCERANFDKHFGKNGYLIPSSQAQRNKVPPIKWKIMKIANGGPEDMFQKKMLQDRQWSCKAAKWAVVNGVMNKITTSALVTIQARREAGIWNGGLILLW